MNNEPVAWMQIHYKDGTPTKFSKVQTWENDIPLYTHPADLTDEEILKMASDKFHYSEYRLVIEFTRAILRKAQEK